MRICQVIIGLSISRFAIAATNAAQLKQPHHATTSRKLMEEPCRLLKMHIRYGTRKHGHHDETWECEISDGAEIVEIDGLDIDRMEEEVISGETTLYVPGAYIHDGRIELPTQAEPVFGRIASPVQGMNQEDGAASIRRVLVLRVAALDSSTTSDEETVSDQVFGTNGDMTNLKTQMNACSHGQMQFLPTLNANFTNGVYTVSIDANVTGASHGTIRNLATNAFQGEFGAAGSQFDHVMLCIPPGTDGNWIAYAYVDYWLSVYNDKWCNYMSPQMHEIGHNLGLGHSGEGMNSYADQSGMMGYSYGTSNWPRMCFNGAKTYRLGWFSDRHVTVNPLLTPSWNGELVGGTDYPDSQGRYLIVKVLGDATNDYFINFNRRILPNNETREGGDQIMIAYEERDQRAPDSLLVAKLSEGDDYRIENFGGMSYPLIVTVNRIELDGVGPGYADITITGVPGPTPPPTHLPTPQPTPLPTKRPTPMPTRRPTSFPTYAPTPTPTVAITSEPTEAPTLEPFEMICTCRETVV